jgi:hypothetical protein
MVFSKGRYKIGVFKPSRDSGQKWKIAALLSGYYDINIGGIDPL